MTQGHPAAERLQMVEAPRQVAALQRFGATGLDPTIAHLVEMRASQLNGAFCLDMHWKDARAAGEEEARLYLLDAWRESPDYSARERAALARLLCTIAAINTWNRLPIATRAEPGHYRPGDFGEAAAGVGGGEGNDVHGGEGA